MEVSSEKSKVMVNSTNSNTCVNITMNRNSLEVVSSLKYLGAILPKDGTCNFEVVMDCRSHGSDGQIGKNMEDQKQLSNKVQTVRIAGSLHSPIWMLNMDTVGRYREEDLSV